MRASTLVKSLNFRTSSFVKLCPKDVAVIKSINSSFFIIINVSLTYLRGLEIAELKEDDMPMVNP
tara:strand:+ start:335 stop:529 length:195 start_codon:yes stop_codon:yes gene_type:complete